MMIFVNCASLKCLFIIIIIIIIIIIYYYYYHKAVFISARISSSNVDNCPRPARRSRGQLSTEAAFH